MPCEYRVRLGRARPARARRGAALALLLLAALLPPAAASTTASNAGDSAEDEESDQAAFVVAVQRGSAAGAARCAGALVSQRAVLTTAWCARGAGPPPAELWALAGSRRRTADCIRRVVRVAVAAGARAEEEDPSMWQGASRGALSTAWRGAWGGAARDLALLELAAAFGADAASRPVILAPAPGNCSATLCYTVRGAARGRLNIETLAAGGAACARAAPHWPTVRDTAVCYRGPELCQADWGAGVVCNGVLCGVVSRSARAALAIATGGSDGGAESGAESGVEGGAEGGAADCGNVHAVQSVPLWHTFLECANTLRACGRGQCARVCTERRLPEGGEASAGGVTGARVAPPATTPRAVEIVTDGNTGLGSRHMPAALLTPTAVVRPPTPRRRLPSSPQPKLTPPTPVHESPTERHVERHGERHQDHHLDRQPERQPQRHPEHQHQPATHLDLQRVRNPERQPDRPWANDENRRSVSVMVLPTRTAPPEPLSSAAPRQRDYEPYRPDFKAGEYGDNAADYNGVDEDAHAASLAPAPPSALLPGKFSVLPSASSPLAPVERRQPPSVAASSALGAPARLQTPVAAAGRDEENGSMYLQAQSGDATSGAGGEVIVVRGESKATGGEVIVVGEEAVAGSGDAGGKSSTGETLPDYSDMDGNVHVRADDQPGSDQSLTAAAPPPVRPIAIFILFMRILHF